MSRVGPVKPRSATPGQLLVTSGRGGVAVDLSSALGPYPSAWPDEVERLAGRADKSGVAPCTKNYYADQASARKALRFAREKAKPGMKVPHRVYPCDVCDGWHLTSKASGRKLPPWDQDPSWSRPSVDGLERRGRAGSSKGSRHQHAQR
jgi:hypothetical protein